MLVASSSMTSTKNLETISSAKYGTERDRNPKTRLKPQQPIVVYPGRTMSIAIANKGQACHMRRYSHWFAIVQQGLLSLFIANY